MDPILQRFRDKFIEEANTLLDRLEKDILELENNPSDKELIESAFRIMHTLKGVSGMYGFDFICEFTHHMENIYQSIREDTLKFTKEIGDVTFHSVDHIRKLLSDENLNDSENQKKHDKLMEKVNEIISNKPVQEQTQAAYNNPAEIGLQTWHILLRTNEMMFFRGISLINIFKELSELGSYQINKVDVLSGFESDTWSVFLTSTATEKEIRDVFLFIEDDCTIVNLSKDNILEEDEFTEEEVTVSSEISILDYIEGKDKPKNMKVIQQGLNEKSVPVPNERTIKRISVDSDKLDHLMFLVSELITVNSQLSLSTRDARYDSIRPYLEKVDSLSKLFRNNTLEIRLVPLSDSVLRFQRLIRDLSKQLGKKIELVTQGTDTELDKNTIDQLNEPLMHIIRNCIDHGIEDPKKRIAAGKPEKGSIKLSAIQSGNYVVITVEDDGTGIDMEKVRLKAVEKGLLKPTDKPTRQEIYDFIFLPGFSTAESLTEVSGRGVGMDVVRKKIIDLRGDITVYSDFGVGTSFTLRLQQSVAIIDSLLFKVEESYFTVPLSDILICRWQLQRKSNFVPIRQPYPSTIN